MIVFRRTNDDSEVGRINKTGNGLKATGAAVSILDVARQRGDSDQQIIEKYTAWSNGYLYSQVSGASERRVKVKEAMGRG